MHSRKIAFFVLALAIAVGVGAIGVVVLDGSSGETGDSTPGETNQSTGVDDSDSPSGAELVIRSMDVTDAAVVGETVNGSAELAVVGDGTVTESVTFSISLDGEPIAETTTEVEATDVTTIFFEELSVPKEAAESVLVSAETTTDEHVTELETYEPVGTDGVALYPYHQNTSDDRLLDGDELIITDATGEEVERFDDWTVEDARDGLRVEGLTEGEQYTVEIPEPHDGTWPAVTDTFDPAETDELELVAGYEFNSADTFRMVETEYWLPADELDEGIDHPQDTRYLARGYANDGEDFYSKMQRIDESFEKEGYQRVIDNGSSNEGGITLSSDYEEGDFVVNGEDDGNLNLSTMRTGYGASAQNHFDNRDEELERFEFIEEIELSGSVVKNAVENDSVVTDETKIIEWVPSLVEADEALEEMRTLHIYRVELPESNVTDYQYRYVDPKTGQMVRLTEPWPSGEEEYQASLHIEYFGHDNTGPEDFTTPILHPDNYDMGERYDEEEILDE